MRNSWCYLVAIHSYSDALFLQSVLPTFNNRHIIPQHIEALYTNIPHQQGFETLDLFRSAKEPSTSFVVNLIFMLKMHIA